MKGDIKLHPKHGLNPTLIVCFWCGKDTGEIALLGAHYKGEAPMRMVTSYRPCKKCNDAMKRGITIMEVMSPSDGHSPFEKEGRMSQYAPTGRWLVVTESAVSSWVTDKSVLEDTLTSRKMMVPKQVMDNFVADIKALKEMEKRDGDSTSVV